MPKWNEIQMQAKKLIDEGMHALKSGFTEAEFLAETTYSAARLHMDTGRKRFELYRALHDLGAVLYNAALATPSTESIPLTPAMKALVANARALDEMLTDDTRRLGRISIVKGAVAPKKKALKARPSARGGRTTTRHP